ncbi:MAG TPA: CDP-diacylglycerol--serine O-phosphatidyltransferase [Thermoanaerobaculia bacterium]|nr:CDP-diacylglycerol--serine O-phosphatidyltransferase [Thermoanaerobaculia bacterium]
MKRSLRRGVYVIPTTLTVLNIFFGFTAILLSVRGMQANVLGEVVQAGRSFQLACLALLVAAVFDTFDGLVARLMHATSEFGKEYDSLADVVTFGAAPAILVWAWALNLFPRLGGGIAFLFLVGGSLRLARFNISTAKTDHRYFVGLPIPAAALTLAAIIYYAPQPVTDRRFAAVILFVVIGLAFAMVSTIRYRSQKFASLQRERSGTYFLLFALALVLMWKWSAQVFFLTAITYVSSGPFLKLWSIAFPPRREAPAGEPSCEPSGEPSGEPSMEPAGDETVS